MHVVPMTLVRANAFVKEHHRHHGPAVGHRLSIGVADEGGKLVGVAILGRPTARMSDNGETMEITRVATDGCPNACSFLYAQARRLAHLLGYKRLLTYTLPEEGGASLRGAGYKLTSEAAGGGSWSRPSRLRTDKAPLQSKSRWEAEMGK